MIGSHPPYNINLQSREEELDRERCEQGGRYAARTLDGTATVAYADTREELRAELQRLGVDRQHVVFAYVQPCDDGQLF